jgi:hypothetical protein
MVFATSTEVEVIETVLLGDAADTAVDSETLAVATEIVVLRTASGMDRARTRSCAKTLLLSKETLRTAGGMDRARTASRAKTMVPSMRE